MHGEAVIMEQRHYIPPGSTYSPHQFTGEVSHDSERDPIEAAREELMRAEAQFSEEVKRASFVGGNLVHRTLEDAKPMLLTIAVATTVGVAVIVYAVSRGRREPPVISLGAPPRSSLLRSLAMAGLGAAARFAARRVAQRLVHGARHSIG